MVASASTSTGAPPPSNGPKARVHCSAVHPPGLLERAPEQRRGGLVVEDDGGLVVEQETPASRCSSAGCEPGSARAASAIAGSPCVGGHSSTDRDDRHRVGPRRAAATVTARRSRAAPARPISGGCSPRARTPGWPGSSKPRAFALPNSKSELARASSRDPISSQLLTLRTFRTQLELDVQRAERYGRPLAVAVLDIDRFRQFNLEHGYGAGDLVLARVGGAITAAIRDQRPRLPGRRRRVRDHVPRDRRRRRPRGGGSHPPVAWRAWRPVGSAVTRPRPGSPRLSPGRRPRACSPPRPRRSRPRAPEAAGRRPCSPPRTATRSTRMPWPACTAT